MITLNSEFWNKRYLDKETGWDIGYVSTPIKEYFNQVKNKELKILIPGGGNSHEAEEERWCAGKYEYCAGWRGRRVTLN